MRPRPTAAAGSGEPFNALSDSVMADLARMGVPKEQLQAAQAARLASSAQGQPGGEPDLVLAQHLLPAVQLGIELRTQVRTQLVPVGERNAVQHLGLDYGARDSVMRALGLPRRGPAARALLSQFRVVESEMMAVLNGPAV